MKRRYRFSHGNHQHKGDPMPPEVQTLNLPMTTVAGLWFNLNSLIGVDVSAYKQGAELRQVQILLVGPHVRLFTGVAADEAYLWYLNMTGQARVEVLT